LLNPAPSAIAFDIVFREAFREVERVVLNSLLSTRAIGRLNLRDRALEAKAKEFWDIIKIGRTHLMDATPIRLGQEFSGYAQQVGYARERVEKSIEVLREIALGETAVGTGLNRHIDLPKKMLRHLEQRTGIAFTRRKIISKRRAEKTQWSKRVDWLLKTLNLCACKKSKFEISSTANSSRPLRSLSCRAKSRHLSIFP